MNATLCEQRSLDTLGSRTKIRVATVVYASLRNCEEQLSSNVALLKCGVYSIFVLSISSNIVRHQCCAVNLERDAALCISSISGYHPCVSSVVATL